MQTSPFVAMMSRNRIILSTDIAKVKENSRTLSSCTDESMIYQAALLLVYRMKGDKVIIYA